MRRSVQFHKGQLRTKIFPVVDHCCVQHFVVFAKFSYISSAFPDIRWMWPLILPLLFLLLACGKLSHSRGCPKILPSAHSMLLGTCAWPGCAALLLAIETRLSSFPPSLPPTFPHRGRLLQIETAGDQIEVQWKHWGSFCCLPDSCLPWAAPRTSWFPPSLHLSWAGLCRAAVTRL